MEAHKLSCLPQHVCSHLRGEIKGWGEGEGWGGRGEEGESQGLLRPRPYPLTLRHPGGPASSRLCPEALPPGCLHEAGGAGEGMDDGGKGGKSKGWKEGPR